ncbi:hypothetical protein J437_LFUL018543, partial [Ladona fulva]
IERAQREQKVKYDKKHKPPKQYQRGDLVVVEREAQASGVSRKLAPKYKGSYFITEVLPRDRYVLKDLPGAKRTQRSFNSIFSAGRMKPWCGTLEEGDEASQEETDEAGADGLAGAVDPGELDRENRELSDKADLRERLAKAVPREDGAEKEVDRAKINPGPRTALLSGKADCGTRDEQKGMKQNAATNARSLNQRQKKGAF